MSESLRLVVDEVVLANGGLGCVRAMNQRGYLTSPLRKADLSTLEHGRGLKNKYYFVTLHSSEVLKQRRCQDTESIAKGSTTE